MTTELTKRLLGPDGEPLTPAITSKVAHEVVDEEVGKVVRHQGTTLASVWDRHRGKPKPSPVTYTTLRMMSNRNEWIRAIIKTRKNQIGKVEWAFQPPDGADTIGPGLQKLIDRMTKLCKRPSLNGSRPHSRSWRQFIGEVLEDLLTLDAGCIEKERTRSGWIAAMYPVDGATIRPNIDERGGFYAPDAYVQLVDGQVTARFGLEDLIYVMDNPLTDVRFAGYGYSPLESLIVSVTAELYASKYQSSYFEKGSVPEGILNLGEDVAPEDVDAFRLYWMNEIMGKPWAIPIVGGKGVEWQPWRASNKDMEYMQYQSWLLKKMCAVYQIAPQEIGELEDVNRTTANDQDRVNTSKSIEPITTLLKDYLDVELVGEHGQGIGDFLEFTWLEEGTSQEEILSKYSVMIPMGAATRREFRDEMGFETPDEGTTGAEGLEMFLSDGSPSPLPSDEDAHQMGAAAQAEQQAQMGPMGMQQPGAGMPFSDQGDDHPAVQEAQAAHQSEQRNTQGGPPFGKTSDWTPHPDHNTVVRDPKVKSYETLKQHLIDQSAKHGGAWTAHVTFGEAKQFHFRNRSSVPGRFQGESHHHDGLAVNGKWEPWTEAQRIREQQVGGMKTHDDDDLEKMEGHDRDPALTSREESAIRVWERQQKRLVEGIAAILGTTG